MPHALTELKLTAVTKPVHAPDQDIRTDVCVVVPGSRGCPPPSSPPGWAGTWFWWTRSR
jgi:hypothetical protein